MSLTTQLFAYARSAASRLLANRELAWTALAQVLLVFQGIIQVKVLTTFLSKSAYGEWALILSMALLVGMLPFTAFDQGVARLCGKLNTVEARASLFARTMLIYAGIFALWVVAVLLTLAILSTRGANEIHAGTSMIAILAFTLSEIVRTAVISFNNASRRRRRVAFHRTWDAVAKSSLLIMAGSFGILSVTITIYILTFSNIAGVMFSWKSFWASPWRGGATVNATLRAISLFSWPLAVWAVFGWFQPMISRWYLAEWAGTGAVAGFAVVVSVSFFAPNFAYTVIASYLLPVLHGRSGPLPVRKHFAMTAIFASCLAAYTLVTIPGAALLLSALTDQKYVYLAEYVPWLTATSSLYVTASLTTAELFRAGVTKKLLVPSIAPGALSVALGLLLVANHGIHGAVVTFMIAQVVYAAATLTVTTRHVLNHERGSQNATTREA